MISIQSTVSIVHILVIYYLKLLNNGAPTHLCIHTNQNDLIKWPFEAYMKTFILFTSLPRGKPQYTTRWCRSTFSHIWLSNRHYTSCKPHYLTGYVTFTRKKLYGFLGWEEYSTQAALHGPDRVQCFYPVHQFKKFVMLLTSKGHLTSNSHIIKQLMKMLLWNVFQKGCRFS